MQAEANVALTALQTWSAPLLSSPRDSLQYPPNLEKTSLVGPLLQLWITDGGDRGSTGLSSTVDRAMFPDLCAHVKRSPSENLAWEFHSQGTII